MTSSNSKYETNFSARGLLHKEFGRITSLLNEDDFLFRIKGEIKVNEIIGIATEQARKRAITEIVRRYEAVPKSFWDWFVNLSSAESKLALFYVCLKTYPIVLDFHLEVALKKYRTGSDLNAFSIQMRVDELSAKYEEIENWSETTINKINSQYRTTLRDCGLLEGETLIQPLGISNSFWNYFQSIGENWFQEMCFN